MAFDMEKLKQCQAMATAARQRSGKMLAEANAVLAECERQRLANADSQVKALLDEIGRVWGQVTEANKGDPSIEGYRDAVIADLEIMLGCLREMVDRSYVIAMRQADEILTQERKQWTLPS